MKNFVYSLFLFAMAAMVLASCGTQLSTLSITKRHYNSGYYVEMNRAKHKTGDLSSVTKTLVTEATPVTQAAPAEDATVTEPGRIIAGTGTTAASQNKQDVSKTLTASAEKHLVAARPAHVLIPNTLKELKNIQAISKRIVSENKGHDNKNGSLIWTIIVILLVLWLISLLTGGWGLGGLIYILLVIALILLILKLLGLI